MRKLKRRGRSVVVLGLVLAWTLLALHSRALALNPSLEVSQYEHTAWTVRDGFSLGNVYAMAQTPDGYLWLGTEFGLFRFDGVRFIPWQPPAGQHLPDKNINSLLAARDGTLWIGTFAGLVILRGGNLTRPPALDDQFVSSLFEDSEGTVWASSLGTPTSWLCALRSGSAQCYGEDGAFGRAVWALYEDSSGTLWAGAESGLWRMKPGPPRRYATPTELIGLTKTDDGRLLIALHGGGLMQLVGDKLESYPIRSAINRNRLLRDRDVNSNKLLRDRDGGLWIGTVERGLIHVNNGRAEVFTRANGLSGDVVLSLFEDREGNVWVASTGGLDRFRELPVTTISVKQGLSSDATHSVLAARDGSVWVSAHDGLTRWKNGQTIIFRKGSGLPDVPQSMYQDDRGRIWVSTAHGLAYFEDGRFVATNAVRGGEVYSFTEDKAGSLWLSSNQGLLHLLEGRLVEQIPWSALGRRQQAKVVVPDQGGVWLAFWVDGGVLYFKDGQIRASYTAADGLGEGNVQHLQLDGDGALWAATQKGGLSRIKDGRIATLTSRSGLPCDTINWSIEDDERSLWLWTGCGLVRITRSELVAWIADPARRVETTVWDASDGVRLRSTAASGYAPTVAKSNDGRLWFVTGEGIQVVDPRRLAVNNLPPPVHIEQITANGKTYDAAQGLRLSPLIRDLAIDFTALSLVAPEKIRFRYMLEGQDPDWKEVAGERRVQYSNLGPGHYRFRVMACNNSGVWNEEGALLDFSIDPAFYQTTWFRVACVALFVALLWAGYQLRIRQLQRQEKRLRAVIEGMPTMAFAVHPDGSPDLVSQRWLDYVGSSADATADGRGWEATSHPDDAEAHLAKWRAALAGGEPFENEVRHRSASGGYRWFLVRALPFHDRQGRIVKWYGSLTDIEDRKRAEQALQRSEAYQAEAQRLTHTGSWAYDPATGKFNYWSEEIFRIHGLDPQRASAPDAEEFYRRILHPEDRDRVHEILQEAFREKTDFEEEYRIVRPDGAVRHLHVIGHPVLDEAGQLVEYVGTTMDVTERKRAEAALSESEQRYRMLFEKANDALFLENERDEIIEVNPRACELLGYSRAELLTMKVSDLQAPEVRGQAGSVVRGEVEKHGSATFESVDLHRSGRRIAVEVTNTPISDQGQRLMLSVVRDITERKRAEEERERVRRLQAELAHIGRINMLGELAASLAHELNQPIAAAITSAGACLRWLDRDQPEVQRAREAARRIENDGKRAADIINRLRAFYKKEAPLERQSVALNEVAREMMGLLGNEADRHAVSLRAELAPDLPPVKADRVQLQQVLMNLMLNAIEAMREAPGELTIKSEQSNGQILVSVSDTGVGLPPGKTDELFNAFFTTKPDGTGMGLAISRSIIEAHAGRLWAAANPGRGATFHFTLPTQPEAHK